MSIIELARQHSPHPAGVIQTATAQDGFTLLEILVAIVVLSIGLLGLAGLQVASLGNNQVAYYRGIASQQTYDMADRIRADLAGVTAGNYDNLTAAIPVDPACFTAGCSVANSVLTDQFQWLTNIAAALPGGTGTVRCVVGPAATCATNTAGSNRVFDITVLWNEKGLAFNDPACPVGTPANTRCFVTRFAP